MYDDACKKKISRLVIDVKILTIICVLLCSAVSVSASTLASHFAQLNAMSPHPPGSNYHTKTRDYIVASLKKAGAETKIQEFAYINPFLGPQKGYNIIATFKKGTTAIAFASHWDTRPVADREFSAAARKKPVFGANDGNSSTAVLLALADEIGKRKNNTETIHLYFFDAEDSGIDANTFCIGSQYFVKTTPPNIRFGILLDMIGDKDLQIYYEGYSYDAAPQLTKKVWDTARAMGYTFFHQSVRHYIVDDHKPFLDKGIPFIDIIDFDYPQWHTLDDTPANCSVPNMEKILQLVRKIAENSREY